jgi:hypothetical protein
MRVRFGLSNHCHNRKLERLLTDAIAGRCKVIFGADTPAASPELLLSIQMPRL